MYTSKCAPPTSTIFSVISTSLPTGREDITHPPTHPPTSTTPPRPLLSVFLSFYLFHYHFDHFICCSVTHKLMGAACDFTCGGHHQQLQQLQLLQGRQGNERNRKMSAKFANFKRQKIIIWQMEEENQTKQKRGAAPRAPTPSSSTSFPRLTTQKAKQQKKIGNYYYNFDTREKLQ